MKFRKKPVEIEAWPIRDLCYAAEHDWPALPQQIQDLYDRSGVVFTAQGIHIPTLEGIMFGALTDLLIEGVQGEFYPCKPDIFEATYEPVEAESNG